MTRYSTRPPACSALAAALALAACSPAADTTTDTPANGAAPVTSAPASDTAPSPTPRPSPAASSISGEEGATTGGDGSEIRLSALSASDISSAKLDGELACSFAGRDGAALLHAAGHVGSSERAFGVVKVADSVESISAPGGFDGMLRGTTFSGRGKTIRIRLGTEKPAQGGESPPRAATLTYERMDGASRSYPGTWTCGP